MCASVCRCVRERECAFISRKCGREKIKETHTVIVGECWMCTHVYNMSIQQNDPPGERVSLIEDE